MPIKEIASMTNIDNRIRSINGISKSYKTIIVGTKTISKKIINAIFDKAFPKKKASLLIDDSKILLITPVSTSVAYVRFIAITPPKIIAIHNIPDATVGMVIGILSKPRLKVKTINNEKTKTDVKISLVLNSRRASFQKITKI